MNSGNADIEPHIKFEQDVLLECSTMCYVAGVWSMNMKWIG